MRACWSRHGRPADCRGGTGDVFYTPWESRLKRTQLYLDEEMARTLKTLSRQKGMTVSELVRAGLRERYMSGKAIDKAALARNLSGIWKDREDLDDIDAAVRKLRSGSRLERFRIG